MKFQYAKKTENLRPSAIRALAHFIHRPGVISFAGGSPAPESFPVKQLIEADRKVLEEKGGEALQYSTTIGLDELREIIIEHMAAAGIHGIQLENILITNGSQQGLDYLGRLFLDEGDIVICEDPSYLGAVNAFAAYAPKMIGIPMDDEGMRADVLEQVLQQYSGRVKFIYTIPTFQNPTGRTMGQERRQQILKLAEKYQVPIAEDDPYSALYFNKPEYPIKHYDTDQSVIYLGTFSKTFCPGLRIGWIAADAEIIRTLDLIKQSTDLHTSTLSQMELVEYIRANDWDEHVAFVRDLYKKKRDIMMQSIETHFPKNVKCTYPEGGLFTWAELPENVRAEDVLEECMQVNVAFVPGTSFYVDGGRHNHMRLSYGMMSEDRIRTGIERLGKILHRLCD